MAKASLPIPRPLGGELKLSTKSDLTSGSPILQAMKRDAPLFVHTLKNIYLYIKCSMAAAEILEWSGSSKRDLMDFPEDVRRAFGYALGVAQLGAKHPSAKPWKGEGAGGGGVCRRQCLSCGLHGAIFQCGVCAALFSKEVTQWHTHGQDRYRTCSQKTQGCAAALRGKL